MRSVSLMLCPVPKPLGAPLHLISGSVTMADRVVLKQHPRWQEPLDRFSNRGRSGGSQTRTWGTISTFCSATVADQVALKLGARRTLHEIVQQPWQIKWFSNLWVWICRLNWAFLFQRTAKSARSSCFCDPPGRFFDRALGSPQAYIPALTTVWVHFSRTIP